jgi:outer membrane protein assembly factor BamA
LTGGANVRGYTELSLSGERMFGINFKAGLPNPFKLIKPQLAVVSEQFKSIKFDFFYDFGSVWNTDDPPPLKNFYNDAGLGLVYETPYLDQIFSDSQVRLDFPFWLDKPQAGEKHFKFRWLFSIGGGIL